mmetsp:Transcript_12281/g.23303  ORF Transcript_12281/g.23303 Transcript_12281/m.23303 type:complete len:171 (-) Transcript_12281:707-1219(-)
MALVEDAFMGSQVVLCYHFPCLDGAYACLCASLYFKKKFPHATQRFEPFKLDDLSERDFTGETLVIFLDVLPELWFPAALRQAEMVVIVDHHLTNQKVLDAYRVNGDFPTNLTVNFDLEIAAAKLAYMRYESEIENDQLRQIIDYVGDADIWKWSLPSSHAVSCFMQATV